MKPVLGKNALMIFIRNKHFIDEKNPRIVTKIGKYNGAIIGSTSLPRNQVTSWNIKILKSKFNDGDSIYIGVVPFDIDQREVIT